MPIWGKGLFKCDSVKDIWHRNDPGLPGQALDAITSVLVREVEREIPCREEKAKWRQSKERFEDTDWLWWLGAMSVNQGMLAATRAGKGNKWILL